MNATTEVREVQWWHKGGDSDLSFLSVLNNVCKFFSYMCWGGIETRKRREGPSN